jgi:hypothetical protein
MTIFEQRNFQATEPGVKGTDEYQDGMKLSFVITMS